MQRVELTTEELCEMTMDLLIKRLSEESPHLSNPEHGNGILEIIYNFNSAPRICDHFSLIKQGGGEFEIKFPTRDFDKSLLKKNIAALYYVVQTYLSTRIVPQGKIIVEFRNGVISGLQLNNEGTYRDLERTGKSKFDLDDLLFGDEEE